MVSFEPQPLDADKNSDVFFSDAKEGIQAIHGSGQMIYWKQCTIKVFDTKNVDKVVNRHSKSDGQAIAKRGVSLLFEDGWVKEED